MKKQLLLTAITTVLMATTPNSLVGLTVEIDRAYTKGLKDYDIPYYVTTRLYNNFLKYEKSPEFPTKNAFYRYYEPTRLPIQIFAEIIDSDSIKVGFGGKIKTGEKTRRIELKRDSNVPNQSNEYYTIPDEKIPKSLKSIEITIGGFPVKKINFAGPQDQKIIIPLETSDLKDINSGQGFAIRNEVGEPLMIQYSYKGNPTDFFTQKEVAPVGKIFYTRHPLLKAGPTELIDVTVSYANGTIIERFSNIKRTPYAGKEPLAFKNFLPLNLTIDNQSSSALTLQKKINTYSFITEIEPTQRFNVKTKGENVTKEETLNIDAHKKVSYEFTIKISMSNFNEFSAEKQKIETFEVTNIDKIKEISVSPNSRDYCSSSLFTLDLQDTSNDLLSKKSYKSVFALKLTVKDAPEDDEDNAFGSSCKKLTFSLTTETKIPKLGDGTYR